MTKADFLKLCRTDMKLQCYHNLNGENVAKWATYPFRKNRNPMKYLKDQAWEKQNKFNSALIYTENGGDIPVFKLLDGMLVKDTIKKDNDFYGADYSRFKLKILTADGQKLPPFYSNILHDDEMVFVHYINRFIRTIFKDNLANAMIYLNKEEKEVAQIVNKIEKGQKTGFLYRSQKFKQFTDIDKIFPPMEQYINMRKLRRDSNYAYIVATEKPQN